MYCPIEEKTFGKKNPAYGRHILSLSMQIETLIAIQYGGGWGEGVDQ